MVTSDLKTRVSVRKLLLSAESASLWITLINRAAATLRLPSPVWAEAGGASDGNELASFGVAVIDALAPSGGLLHNPNKEYLDLATVEPRLRLIEKALEPCFRQRPGRLSCPIKTGRRLKRFPVL